MERPDREALPQEAGRAVSRSRGRLKVFFGACAGVGKTHAMLQVARRKKAEGVDVVAGWIDTHGRPETAALLEGLETLPSRTVEDRGAVLHAFDLDAALRRRPTLLLLDELAHTNAAGARHAKRWQDVEELLESGVDIWTTLSVEHLGSLSDVVARITEIPVQELVPDSVLDEADEVEFVDLSPDDLLERRNAGKVHTEDEAGRFFRKGNLIALRELALRRIADRVDDDVRVYRRTHAIKETWPVAERILVCVRPNPQSGQLVQAARRLAARLRAEWIVAYAESPSQPVLSDIERHALAEAFKLAEQLGAVTAVLSGESVGQALLTYAREHNVSKIVAGKPARTGWRDRLLGSPVDEIVRGSGEIDVYVISGKPEPVPRGARTTHGRAPGSAYAWAFATVILSTLLCRTIASHFDTSNLIMIYLLGVAFVATRFGRGPSAVAACLSVAAFDFFFVPPHLTFAVADTQYLVTFAVMLVVAMLVSSLAGRVRDQAEAARRREQRTRLLYETTRELSGLTVPEEISRAACRHVSDVLRGPAALLLPAPDGRLAAVGPDPAGLGADPQEVAAAEWVFRHERRAGRGTDTLPGVLALYVALPGGHGPVGVLGVRPSPGLLPLAPEHVDLLETLARLIAAPLERVQLAAAAERARVEVETERLRNTLLSSVSHDFRTPLAAITGATTSLLGDASLADAARSDLTQTIYEEAERLNRLVANLLDMTRLESGPVLVRQWHSLEEIVGSAARRLKRVLAGRRLETALPSDLPLVQVDAALIEQLFVNLLDNAIKYTPPGSTVRISARSCGQDVAVEVADDGPGLPPGDEQRVFEKFFRKSGSRSGFGLGLAICRAVVDAHGGRLWAETREPSGAAFCFSLPRGGEPPAPPEDADELAS